jgi:hypothetical protein
MITGGQACGTRDVSLLVHVPPVRSGPKAGDCSGNPCAAGSGGGVVEWREVDFSCDCRCHSLSINALRRRNEARKRRTGLARALVAVCAIRTGEAR